MYELRFPASDINHWANRYSYTQSEQPLIDLRSTIQQTGHLNRETLRQVAKWKSPRSAGNIEKNSVEFIAEITGFALSAEDERTRIESLTLLDGVSWPTASVILHLFHSDPYPILDFRALWSIGSAPPSQYTFPFWWEYVLWNRTQYQECQCDPRTFDRAVWQYSKENQPKQ